MNNIDSILLNIAIRQRKLNNKKNNIIRWYGRKGGSSKRVYVCYICDCQIDSESAKYPMTKHAQKNIENHGLHHLSEKNLIAFL